MMFQAAGSGGELARAAGLQPGRLPCKGSWMRQKAQTEGLHCRLAAEIPRKVRQGLAPRFAGGAAAGRAQQPGRVFAGQGAAPLRRLRRHLPLQGRLPGRQRTKRLPCKGSWMRRKAQTEGCIAGWRRKYPLKSGRVLPDVLRGAWRPGEHNSPEGYLQGRVRHPSVACGDTFPYRGGFWGMRRPAVPSFAARVPYIVGRAFTPAREEVAAAGAG